MGTRARGTELFAVIALVAITALLAAAAPAAALERPAGQGSAALVEPKVTARLEQAGEVRVLARLRMPFSVEGKLDDAAQRAQRSSIRRLQVRAASLVELHGGEVRRRYETVPWMSAVLGAPALSALRDSGLVSRVVLDRLEAPQLAESVPLVGGAHVQAARFEGTGRVIAVIDTGVDKTHPVLSGKVVAEACFNGTSTCPNGATEMTGAGAAQPCDHAQCDHGTHVASIASGLQPTGSDSRYFRDGVARGSKLLTYQVFHVATGADCGGAESCIRTNESDVLAALEHTYMARGSYSIAAVNLSLTGSEVYPGACDDDPRKDIVAQLKSAGIVTVAAAGNGANRGGMAAPACITNVVSVASSTKTDTISSSTNISTTTDLLAPGDGITAASVDGGSIAKSGTSMASAHVAGAFAVLEAAFPSENVSQLFSRLKNTGLAIADTRSGGSITKPRIDLLKAVNLPTIDWPAAVRSLREDAGTVTVRMRRTGNLNWESSAWVRLVNGTQVPYASPGTDVGGSFPAKVTFAAGQSYKDIALPIVEDDEIEYSESFALEVYDVRAAILPPNLESPRVPRLTKRMEFTLIEDDTVVEMHDAVLAEKEGRSAILWVLRRGNLSATTTVAWQAFDGTAKSGSDYTGSSGTLTFGPNVENRAIKIPLPDNTTPTENKTFTIRLMEVSGAALAAEDRTVVTILNDDVGFRLDRPNLSVNESGGGSAVFRVERVGPDDVQHTVAYSTRGTALLPASRGSDYTAVTGTLTFAPGERTKQVSVSVLDDTVAEGDETFLFRLSGPSTPAQIVNPGSTMVTITDNETGLRLAFVPQVAEAGGAPHVVVERIGNRGGSSAVNFRTGGGTATAGADYTKVSGTLSWAPDEFSKEIGIPILADELAEGDEAFSVVLENPVGAQLLTPTGKLIIVDDDHGVRLSAATMETTEGHVPAVKVLRVGPSDTAAAVDVATSDGTAKAGEDFNPVAARVAFDIGETEKVVDVTTLDDTVAEGDETFVVKLANPTTGLKLGTVPATSITMWDDERGVQFAASAYLTGEASGSVVVEVQRFGPLLGGVSVDVSTGDGTAVGGEDYTPVTTRVTFMGPARTQQVTIPIVDNYLAESTESFRVSLSNVSPGFSIGPRGSAEVKIRDNESVVRFEKQSVLVDEATAGLTPVTLVRSGVTSLPVTVRVRSVESGASPNDDYAPITEEVTFGRLETTKTVQVRVYTDWLVEGNESFYLTVDRVSGPVEIGDPSSMSVSIIDDDTAVRFGDDVKVDEAAGEALVTIERLGRERVGDVSWEAVPADPSSATAGSDFTAVSGTVSFAENEYEKTVRVPILQDTTAESFESFVVRATATPENWSGFYEWPRHEARVTILDDEPTTYTVGPDLRVAENVGKAVVTVQRLGRPVAGAIDWATANGTASSSDYVAGSGRLEFGVNDATKTIAIDIRDDTLRELDEYFWIETASANGWAAQRSTLKVTIAVND